MDSEFFCNFADESISMRDSKKNTKSKINNL